MLNTKNFKHSSLSCKWGEYTANPELTVAVPSEVLPLIH